MYPDLDEVADALLAILEIPGSVAGPSVPVGTSAMVSVQRYDIPKSLEQMQNMLRARGFEMRTSTWSESGYAIHAIWVRRTIA